jgi:hypothetical protein
VLALAAAQVQLVLTLCQVSMDITISEVNDGHAIVGYPRISLA